VLSHDLADAERHIGDEIRAREHIQDRKFRDIVHRLGKQIRAAGLLQAPFSLRPLQRYRTNWQTRCFHPRTPSHAGMARRPAESGPEFGLQKTEPSHQAADIVAHGGEDGVDCIAGLAGEIVAAHSVAGFGMADERLNRRSAPHLLFDWAGYATLLAGGKDLEAMLLRRVVALVTGIAEDALERDADLLLDLGNDRAERVAIIGLGPARPWW